MNNESLPEQWNNREFAFNYLQTADITVVGRERSLRMVKSFYRHFLSGQRPNTVLDLGCGDGVLTREIMHIDDSIAAVLIDGSEDMLEKARQSLENDGRFRFVQASFQELIDGQVNLPEVHFAVSSLAIHHLSATEKEGLFRFIFSRLAGEGWFLNIDTVRSTHPSIEDWYLQWWRQEVCAGSLPSDSEDIFNDILDKYTSAGHYRNIDTLESQMQSLTEAGFSHVDCFYKNGIFAVYGGMKGV